MNIKLLQSEGRSQFLLRINYNYLRTYSTYETVMYQVSDLRRQINFAVNNLEYIEKLWDLVKAIDAHK
jgi:hypothetical protein